MYLATITHGASKSYQIRQSYLNTENNTFQHRIIFDLGENPSDYMENLGEVVVFFSSELENAISKYTQTDPDTILEKLLWDFLPWETRERLSRFNRTDYDIPKPISENDRAEISRQIHIFDRRRLYYLYYGAIDQSKLFSMRETVFRPLFRQSRDEREYHLTQMEHRLEPGEYRNYIYAIFNLHTHFTVSYATFLPEALPQDQIADYFLEELCELNSSRFFLQFDEGRGSLHPHLRRYLYMFFDFSPRNRTFGNDFVRQFINNHRTFRWPEKRTEVSSERILEIFGYNFDELKKMNKKTLTRLYRKKALELHPDQGGDQEKFVELTEIYSILQKGQP
ncbi:DnaJ domain-containing protein [Desulfosediminicola flagellatus]|uniref:DnaJ domain-containing protein n=1 Tax=Desulfosediminicola flagellatus TaxID=2569541 RepID=UPI0010AB877E|nr:DnaJ domain-containing protein [Desulfosediminicola flagellatus]